jgi:hypothetical protein
MVHGAKYSQNVSTTLVALRSTSKTISEVIKDLTLATEARSDMEAEMLQSHNG